jgi:protein TonB
MEANKILNADVLDIIFDGRNKTYGAYELRRTYNKRLWVALITMASVCLFIIIGGFIAKNMSNKKSGPILVQDVQLEEIKTEKPPEIPPPPPVKMPEPPKIEMAKFTTTIIQKKEVKPEERPPEMKDLEEKIPGSFNQEGEKDKGIVAPPVEKGTGVEPPIKPEDNTRYTKVENPAAFPGGPAAWKRYLENNLKADAVVEAGAPPGILTVRVQFIVDKDGNISEVKALNDPGYGTAEEAVRVIKKGPKWKPALQNGRNVIYQAVQGVGFNIQSE